jgi:hypothetical protein
VLPHPGPLIRMPARGRTMTNRPAFLACAAAVAVALCASAPVHAQPASATRPITPEMRASLDARINAVEAIVAAVERGADADSLTAANLIWLREGLYRLTLDQLQAIGTPTSLRDAADALARVRDASPQIGSTSVELVYYPVTPCRYIDTRVIGGAISGTRTYDLAFTGGAFGGSIGCDPKATVGGDEDQIGALAINVAIVGPTAAPAFIGARPAGGTTTTALVNWWEQGPSVQASNAGIVSTNQATATSAEIEFFGGPSHIIVDVFGVFAAPTATALDCVAGTIASTTLNTTTRNFDLTAGACPAGYAKVSVNCSITGGDFAGGKLRRSQGGINNPNAAATCAGYYTGATTVGVTAQARCCRVPGR